MKSELLTAIQTEAREAIEQLNGERIVVWGAGELGRWLMHELEANGVAFVDTNPTKIGESIAERAVHSPELLDDLDFDEVWVSVLSDSAGIAELLIERELPHRLVFPGGKRLQVQDGLERTLEFLGPHDLKGREILEVGCGGQLFLSLTLLHLGAKSVRVSDVGPLGDILRNRESEWRAFLTYLEGVHPAGHDATELLTRLEIEQRPLDAARLPFEHASFDAIVNTGVMEHVDDPKRAIGEFARLLRPGGLALCLAIGIHDHRSNDPKADFTPWSFLNLDAKAWSELGGGAYHQNRWRSVDFTRCFEASGFRVLSAEATCDARLTAEQVQRFAPEFRDAYTLVELAELDSFVAAERS